MKKYSVFSQYGYVYGQLWNYNKKLYLLIILNIVCGVISPLANIILPAVIVGMLANNFDFMLFVFINLGLFSLFGIFNAAMSYLNIKIEWEYIFFRTGLYFKFLEHSMSIDYALYENEKTLTKMQLAISAIAGDTRGMQGFYLENQKLIISLASVILYSLVLFRIHFLVVIGLVSFSVIQYLFYVLAIKYEIKHQDKMGEIHRNFEYLIRQSRDVDCGKDVRLYQLQHWLIDVFKRLNKQYLSQLFKNNGLYFLYDLVGLILQVIRDGIAYVYLIYLLKNGLSVSEVVLYIGIIHRFGDLINQISNSVSLINGCLVGISNYMDYFNIENIYLSDKGMVLDNKPFIVEFDKVSFKYGDNLILDNISFKIEAGEKVALVGVNGAGKSTLVKIMCGLYQPTSGRVLINGIDIKDLNIKEYFARIAVLFQETFLLSVPIANNIACVKDEEIDFSKLSLVIEKSGLKDKIDSLEQKEFTYLGKDISEDGVSLSGGEVQRLLLARCLYKDANLLILDEPTAALDALAESQLYEKYYSLVSERTSVFISHRLSSTRFCDRIFVLDKGKIIENGNHEQLLANNGFYKKMFDVQSQYYLEEENQDA